MYVYFSGLAHVDATVAALVEIIHAFTLNDFENIDLATKLYLKLLLCPSPLMTFTKIPHGTP
ncbi:hypothetical protein KUTeg_021695 [Tegillarca granosa]|uniref:Uncharacterized protein n=1 Tax=Tegillarca granosa TaxID=220873 RepID=A0ABQ9E8R5_TEGGR|nr:hypothetical protein KUTeg_021695 [Tegillarca granosa]